MTRVAWAEDARSDLRSILAYIAERNPDASEAMSDHFESAAERLARFPTAWRPGRRPGAREMVVHPNYILVYRVEETLVRIVNVLHTSQQYP
ncbi:type II toxin-antitoxin system RelE/ParE family toxin [Brevundimonas sp.]|uniref:type II toxin-antitoxin system RelE/ParE family toxin n=1 Tax=Brevundimonas sp. TaxID=1871086 RepID=UPI003F7114D0